MSWLPLSITALCLFVLYDLAGRYFATRSENPQAFSVIYNAIVAAFTPLLFFLDPVRPGPINLVTGLLAVVGLFVWGLYGRFEYFSKKHVEASTLSIVGKLDILLNFFLVLIFLHEPVTLSKLAGIGLILLANLILFWGTARKSVISDQGLKYAFIAAVILAFGWLFDTINVRALGVATYTTLSFIAPVVLGSVFPTLTVQQLKRELVLTPLWQFVVLGLANLIAYSLMLKALTLGPASNIMPIISSGSPFIVLLGYLFLGEKDHPYRKFVAASLSVFAIYFMR